MTRLSWDAVPLPVQQFIESYGNGRDGMTIEENGRPLFRLIPCPPAGDAETLIWNEDDNRRRLELIDRDLDDRISPEERIELESLRSRLRIHIDRVAPLPWDFVRKLEAELLEKASRANGAPAP